QARLGAHDRTLRAWGGGEVEKAHELEDIFLQRFVDAVHGGRCFVHGIPCGEHTATDVPAALITVRAFKDVKGEREWKLAGAVWYGIDVVMSPLPSPRLRPASESDIHDAIKAEYDDCDATGRKPPNVKEIGQPVQDRLRAKGRDASERRIQELAGDERYADRRRPAGKTVASERKRD